jgi:hypothetical protein
MNDLNPDAAAMQGGPQFIDAGKVVGGEAVLAHDEPRFSPVFEPGMVRFSGCPVTPNWAPKPPDDIKVDVVRDNGRIKGIKIACPCGRHAALDVEYAPNGVRA